MAAKIRLILLDVDGVLTDGRFALLPDGREIKFFSIYDGMGIELARQAGIEVGLISGRKSQSVAARARELGIDILVQNSKDKLKDFEKILSKQNLKAREVAYIGDDLPDIPVLERAGFSAAPANAPEMVKSRVDYVSAAKGGEGAVREIIEHLLKMNG